jgi:hypothetical protein
VESNLDVLRLTFNRFVAFWGIADTLQERLRTLESRLQSILSSERSGAQSTHANLQADVNSQAHPVKSKPNVANAGGPSNEVPRNERLEDFTSMSGYFPPQSAFASPGVTYDPAYPLPDGQFNFGGFPMAGFESWESTELEELLTYGYDGAGVALV